MRRRWAGLFFCLGVYLCKGFKVRRDWVFGKIGEGGVVEVLGIR